jgi:hypothetical protein
MTIPSEILGTIPGWITAVTTVAGFVWAFLRFGLGWRKISVEAHQVDVNATNALNTHTAKELQSLRDQITAMGKHQLEREREIDDRWRKALGESEERHDECVKQREELGRKVIALEQKLIGTIRQFIHFQQRIAEAIAKGSDTRGLLASLQPFLEEEMKIEVSK